MTSPEPIIIIEEAWAEQLAKLVAQHRVMVLEGMCPIHKQPLERHELCGWCHRCEAGYSADRESIYIHHPTPHAGSSAVLYGSPTTGDPFGIHPDQEVTP